MRAECHALAQEFDAAHQHTDDEGSDEARLHTGDTTEAEETDLDETDDEASDPEYDHDDGDNDRTTDRHP